MYHLKLYFLESDEINNTLPDFPIINEKEFFFTEDQNEYKNLSHDSKDKIKELGKDQWNKYKTNVYYNNIGIIS